VDSQPANPQRPEPSALICEGDSGGPAVRGASDDSGSVCGVASTTTGGWDWYGDVIYYRSLMDYIATGRQQPEFRKNLVRPRP
jgi:hypothetical protein